MAGLLCFEWQGLLPNQPHKLRLRTREGLTSWHDCLRFDFQDTMAVGKWLGDIFLKSSGLGNGLEICFLRYHLQDAFWYFFPWSPLVFVCLQALRKDLGCEAHHFGGVRCFYRPSAANVPIMCRLPHVFCFSWAWFLPQVRIGDSQKVIVFQVWSWVKFRLKEEVHL